MSHDRKWIKIASGGTDGHFSKIGQRALITIIARKEIMHNVPKTLAYEDCEGHINFAFDLISGSRDLKSKNRPRRNCRDYSAEIMRENIVRSFEKLCSQ